MTDIKGWLESAGFEGRVAEHSFPVPVSPPYVVYLEEDRVWGGDFSLDFINRELRVELYSPRIDREAEGRLERLFAASGQEYDKERVYIHSQRYYMTVYELEFMEKLEE